MGNENFQPPFKFCMQLGAQGGCTKTPILKVAALLLPWQQRLLVRGLGPHIHTKTSQKKGEMFISLSQV